MSPNPTPLARQLPHLTLPAAPGGATTSIRPRGRDGVVLVATHGAECQPCRAYLRDLAANVEAIREWDGRVLVLHPGPLEEAERVRAELALPFSILADANREVMQRAGLEGGGISIADQWGEIVFDESGGEEVHPFPEVQEVVEWLRFLAIQCPECQGEAY